MAISGATALVALTSVSHGDTWGENGSSTVLNTPGAWTDETATPTDSAPPSSADIAQFDSLDTLTGTPTYTLGGNISWLGLSITTPAAPVAIGGTGDTGNTLTIGASGINMSSATQSLTLNDPLALSTAETINVGTGATFTNSVATTVNGNLTIAGAGNETFTGAVSASSSALTMNGTGTLTLTAANNIASGLTLNAGTTILGTSSAAGGTSSAGPTTATLTLNGGTIRLTGSASGANGYYNPINVESTSGIASGGQLAGNITGGGQLDVTIGANSTLSLMANATMLAGYNGLIEMGTSAGALRFNGVSGGSTFGVDLGTATASINNRNAGNFTLGLLEGGAGTILEGSTSTNAITTYIIGGLGANTVMAGTIENGTDGSSATTAITLTGGTLTLTGTNPYTGGTTISGGALQVGNNTTTGTMGTGAITDNASLIFNRSDSAYVAANAISGSGTFSNIGTGTVSLTGSNTYGGGTTISAGLVEAENATSALGTGTVSVNSGGALGGIGTITAPVTVASGGIISPGDVGVNHGLGVGVGTLSVAALTLNPGSILNYDLNGPAGNDLIKVTGSNGLTVNGGGIDLYQAGTTNPFETDGTYDIFQLSAPFSGSVTNLLNILNPQGGLTYNWGTSGNDITLIVNGGFASTAWNVNGSGSWIVGGNWTDGSPNGAGTSATFGSVVTGTATVALNGSETVGNVVFNDGSGGTSPTYTISAGSGGTLTLDNGSGQASITDSNGNQSITAPVTLNSNTTIAISNATNTFAISGAVGGVGGIIEFGNGVLLLAGNNTFGGGVTINSGTLQVGSGGASGSLGTSTAAIADNGALVFDLSASLSVANVISGTGSLTQEGAGGTLTLTGTNTYSGTTNINAGTLQYGAGDPSALSGGKVAFTGNGTLDLNGNSVTLSALSGTTGTIDNLAAGATPTLTVNSGSNQTFAGTIQNTQGTMSLTKAGGGTMFLSGANTYTGTTSITAGAIKALSNGAFGLSTISVVSNNGLQLANGVNVSNAIVLNNGSSAEFEDVPDAGATATLSGPITFGTVSTTQQYRIGTSPTNGTGGPPDSTLVLTGASTISSTTADAIVTRGNVVYAQNGSFTSQALLVIGRSSSTAQANLTIQDNASMSAVGIDVGGLAGSSDDVNTTVTISGNGSLSAGTGVFNLDNSSINNPLTAVTITLNNNAKLSAGSFTMLTGTADVGTTSLTVNSGTITATANDPNGGTWFPQLVNGIGALSFSVNGPMTVNNGGFSITIGQEMDGGGAITFTGAGATALTSSTVDGTGYVNTYSGGTTLSQGTLVANNGNNGSATGSGNVLLNGGVLASGSLGGTISGNVSAGSGAHTIAPGNIGSVGTLTLDGSLTTSSLTTLSFDPGAGTGTVTTGSVLVLNSGSVTIGSGTKITMSGTPVAGDIYEVIAGNSGAVSAIEAAESSFVILQDGNFGFTFNNTATPGAIDLQAIFVGPPQVSWNDAAGDNTWNATSSDWNNGSSNIAYADGDAVTFNDNNGGHYAVTLSSTVKPASIAVNNSAGNYTISGTGSIASTGTLTKAGSGVFTIGTPGTSVGAVSITGGSLQLGTSTGLATITSLAISGNGTFDVNNNHVIINYGSSDPIGSISALLKTGYNHGGWNGAGGIISTAAQVNNATSGNLLYGLGYADSADAGNPAGLATDTIEIKYTLLGDANLSGVVDGVDFGIVAANFNKGVTGWDQGDFNYDNVVDGTDFGDLAANFNKGASGGSVGEPAIDDPAIVAFAEANGLMSELTASVPEPASIGLLALGTIGVLARRRRRRD